jgi:hypothetical protein
MKKKPEKEEKTVNQPQRVNPVKKPTQAGKNKEAYEKRGKKND